MRDSVFKMILMKKSMALVFAATALFVAGCSTTPRAFHQWEYKVATVPLGPSGTRPVGDVTREKFLNELGKDGWVLVAADVDIFYLKRPRRSH